MEIIRKKKICKGCALPKYMFSKGECISCANIGYAKKAQEKKRNSQEPYKPKKINQRSKNGQKVSASDSKFFHEIWNERPHNSEITGKTLGSEYNPVFFSHLLTKGAYPKFRHNKDNILLMTFDEHQEWEFSSRSTPMFKAKFKRALYIQEKLKSQYYEKTVKI